MTNNVYANEADERATRWEQRERDAEYANAGCTCRRVGLCDQCRRAAEIRGRDLAADELRDRQRDADLMDEQR